MKELREGFWILKLWGSHYERGYGHGKLLAAEILDFFEFFGLEIALKSRTRYETTFFPHHNTFVRKICPRSLTCYKVSKPEGYKQELEGIIAGMKDSGVSMYIPLLERDFTLEDLHYVNTFVEARTAGDIKANTEISCTQFSYWGSKTKGMCW